MPPNWLDLSFACSRVHPSTKDSYTLDASIVQLMLRNWPISLGHLVLGIIVTDSFFQIAGQTLVSVISLYIEVSGIANRSAYLVTSSGKMSPITIDLGFLNIFSLAATWYACSGGMGLEGARGISLENSTGLNSFEMALKWQASSSATTGSVFSGNMSIISKGLGFCLDR